MRAAANRLPWLGLIVLWSLLGALSLAHADTKDAQGKPLSSEEARKWLARIHVAAHERNYQGTLVFSANGALSSAKVAHFCEGPQSYERIEMLDGRMQQIYRHNDRVFTLWPRSRIAVVEERDPRQASLRPVIEPRAEQSYGMRAQGSEHVAGREAQVVLLSPRDANRFAQRQWVDNRSGLLLRADVLGPDQQVLESSAFSQVEIDVKPRPQSVLQPMKQLDGYRKVRPSQVPTQLANEGWAMSSEVPGFQLTSSTRRARPGGRQCRAGIGAAGGVLRRSDACVAVRRADRPCAPQEGPADPGGRHAHADAASRQRLVGHGDGRRAAADLEAVPSGS